METLRVGIIGVNAQRGWAREAHVPAIAATEGLELSAVATRSQASADAAGAAFGVARAYSDPLELIRDPDVDVVTVASSVSAHEPLIHAALQHGKHVVTEWPVAVGTAAMTTIAGAVAVAGVRSAVGLQARRNPAVLRAAQLLADHTVGRVLVVRVSSTTAGFGPTVDESAAPLEDPDAGMHLLTIQAAHTLDVVAALLGSPVEVSALHTVRFPELRSTTGSTVPRTLPDHVAVLGRFSDGAALVAEVVGGRGPDDTPFRLTIEGSTGVLELVGGAPRGFQAGVLELFVDGQRQPIDTPALPDSVVNVAGVYRALRADVRDGTSTAPSFVDAVRLAHLVDDLRRSDDTRASVTADQEWPRALRRIG
jgi:predicted dehydrogenase